MTRNESGRGDLDVGRQRDTGKPSITEAAQERVHEVTDRAARTLDAATSELDAVRTERVRATARRAAVGFLSWRNRRSRSTSVVAA